MVLQDPACVVLLYTQTNLTYAMTMRCAIHLLLVRRAVKRFHCSVDTRNAQMQLRLCTTSTDAVCMNVKCVSLCHDAQVWSLLQSAKQDKLDREQ
jgi:hypothetical protein